MALLATQYVKLAANNLALIKLASIRRIRVKSTRQASRNQRNSCCIMGFPTSDRARSRTETITQSPFAKGKFLPARRKKQANSDRIRHAKKLPQETATYELLASCEIYNFQKPPKFRSVSKLSEEWSCAERSIVLLRFRYTSDCAHIFFEGAALCTVARFLLIHLSLKQRHPSLRSGERKC
jgi:hypothetical protein